MIEKISPKQKRIVKAKIKGAKLKDIGNVEYPNATDRSKEVLVSRELNKPHVAQYLDKELSKTLETNHVTKAQYIMNIGLAMTADKQNQFTGEITPDIGARLAGNKQAERFLKFTDPPPTTIKEFDIEGMDELELTKAVFRKNVE